MTRLLVTIRTDVRLQFRNGLYYISAGLVVFMVLLLRQLLEPGAMALVLPGILLSTAGGTSYLFAAGMILLEKGQGSLDALIVTPLRANEYLSGKLASVGLLVLLEGLATGLLSYGLGLNLALLTLGLLMSHLLFALCGIALVGRYDVITDFLMPSIVLIGGLTFALLGVAGVAPIWLWLALPSGPAALLLKGAFVPLSAGELAYGLLGGTVWVVVCYVWARRSFERFIVRKERG
jgi:fluoroquinolone transport system permease protein